MPILPGSTLGMLGGGQLGRMFVTAARTMGYEVVVLDPDSNSPAGRMASEHIQAAYTDHEALDHLSNHCASISTEFENIPADSLAYLARFRPVHPSAGALRIAQNRLSEKDLFTSIGLNTAAYVAIESEDDIAQAGNFDFPAILKTTTLGYDGKGQVVCKSTDELSAAYAQLGAHQCLLEEKIDLAKEVSVVLCRSAAGEINCFPLAENLHRNGILDISVAPADLPQSLAEEVRASACRIADGLDYCGVLAVEFFISSGNKVLVNEMAPRPHNSGHYTLDACVSSQFEQQVRMMCGLRAGSNRQHSAVAMWNLLGDIWPLQGEPAWDEVLQQGDAKLHLYGKTEARAGRKMGHINCLAQDTDQALGLLAKLQKLLA